MSTVIVVKNFSTVVSDADVSAALPAFQTQADRDLCPAYGLGSFTLEMRAQAATVSPGEWQIVVLDETSDAEALGYHDETANGDPISYVGALASIRDGATWTEVFSHELCEMLVDPTIDRTARSVAQNRDYIEEACDAVERFTYVIDGVVVSDFVLPDFWRDEGSAAGSPLSFCANVSTPFSLSSGGYLSYVDLSDPSKGWQQIFADRASKPGTSRGARLRAYRSGKPRVRSSRH